MSTLQVLLITSGFINGILVGLLCKALNKADSKSRKLFAIEREIRRKGAEQYSTNLFRAFADRLAEINKH